MSLDINFRLRIAFISGNLEEMDYCLSQGASPDTKFIAPTNITLLHHSPNEKITRLLLQHGADVKATDNYGQTPLHSATSYKKGLSVVRLLLVSGANVNAKDFAGMTPLHYAITYRNELCVVHELLQHGADVGAVDNEGDTPLHLAVGYGCHFSKYEIIRELSEFGADPIAKNKYNNTSILIALQKGDLNCAKQLTKITVFNNFDNDPIKLKNFRCYFDLFNHSELSQYLDACLSEIEQLKKHKFASNLSLKSFIIRRGKIHKTLYPGDHSIDEVVLQKYTIYSDMILPSIKSCMERSCLMDDLTKLCVFTRRNTANKVVLNCDCLYNIAEYLSNDELLKFITAFKHF